MGKISKTLGKVPGKLLIYAYALLLIVPFYFIIMTALKAESDILTNPIGWPTSFEWGNFIAAIEEANLLRALCNSVFVAGCTTVLRVVFNVLIAFCLFKLSSTKLGRLFYLLILASMFIPATGWITKILLYRKLGLYNNFLGLILSGMTQSLPTNMVILMVFMNAIPKELNEAAEIDGCSDWQYLFRIMIPVIKPAMVSIGLLAFTNMWNSLFNNLLLIRDEKFYTISQALMAFKNYATVSYSKTFAGVLICAIPLVVLYFCFQKHFTEAMAGSVKG